MKEEALRSFGLNDKEISVFLTCLKVGSSLVQDIARLSQLNRTSTYDILSSLESKGLVSHTISSGKRFYQAIRPKDLLNLLKQKEELIKDILPELDSLVKTHTHKPKIEEFSGLDSLKNLFESILNESKHFDCMASKKHLFKLFNFYFPHFVEKRKKKGIHVRIISDEIPFDKDAPHKIIKNNIKTMHFTFFYGH